MNVTATTYQFQKLFFIKCGAGELKICQQSSSDEKSVIMAKFLAILVF